MAANHKTAHIPRPRGEHPVKFAGEAVVVEAEDATEAEPVVAAEDSAEPEEEIANTEGPKGPFEDPIKYGEVDR